MDRERVSIRFGGGLADEHRLPAYAGMESISGISRSILIPIHYLHEGHVRRRKFRRFKYDVNIVALREGSFEAFIEIVSSKEFLIPAAAILSGSTGSYFLIKFLELIWNSVLGNEPDSKFEKQVRDGGIPSGDIDAIADATEPALRRGHTVINNYGVINCNISREDESIALLDADSKEYVWTNVIDREPKIKRFSVAGYYVNSRQGRVFDYEERRTLPFEIDGSADKETLVVIGDSLNRYNRARIGGARPSEISAIFTSINSISGKIKKIFIPQARREVEELNLFGDE